MLPLAAAPARRLARSLMAAMTTLALLGSLSVSARPGEAFPTTSTTADASGLGRCVDGRVSPECQDPALAFSPAPAPTPVVMPLFPTPPRTEEGAEGPGARRTPRTPQVPEYTCYDCHKLYLTVVQVGKDKGVGKSKDETEDRRRPGARGVGEAVGDAAPGGDDDDDAAVMGTRLGGRARGPLMCPGLMAAEPGAGAGAGGVGAGLGLGPRPFTRAGALDQLPDQCRRCLAGRSSWRERVPEPYLQALAAFHAQARGLVGQDQLPACQQRAAALVRTNVPGCGLQSYRDAYNALYWSYEDQLARAPTCAAQALIRAQMRAIRDHERATMGQMAATPMGQGQGAGVGASPGPGAGMGFGPGAGAGAGMGFGPGAGAGAGMGFGSGAGMGVV
jgi:hypothetical protein